MRNEKPLRDLLTAEQMDLTRELRRLQESDYPVALFGAGEVASRVAEILDSASVPIHAAWVDDVAYLPGALDQVPTCLTPADVSGYEIVLGRGDYPTAQQRLRERGAQHLLAIDNVYQMPPLTRQYVLERENEFNRFYQSLADQRSRAVMAAFLNSRISGRPDFMFPVREPGLQYFPTSIPDYPDLRSDEVFVDCGAFTGDTVEDFHRVSDGRYRKIFALEPESSNFTRLEERIRKQAIRDVVALKIGASARRDTFSFEVSGIASRVSRSGVNSIDVDRIDALVGDEPVSLIKMDVEGHEIEALQGAESVIARQLPKLAISAYHKPDDLLTIPALIERIAPGYRFYLRSHQYMSIDMVLYALHPDQM